MAGIKVEGLPDMTSAFNKLAAIDEFKDATDEAAEYVYSRARRLIPRLTGAAVNSLDVQNGSVTAGGSKAPYFGWLDFGGSVGPNESVTRPFMQRGRYIWGTMAESQKEILAVAEKAMVTGVEKTGLEVT